MKALRKSKKNERALNVKWSIKETEKTNKEEIEVVKLNLSKILFEFNKLSLKDKEQRKHNRRLRDESRRIH